MATKKSGKPDGKTSKWVRLRTETLVDVLGTKKAVLAEAKTEVDDILTALKDRVPSAAVLIKKKKSVTFAGELFEAVLYGQMKVSTDWAALCEEAKISPLLIKKYTTSTPSLGCRVQARKLPSP